MVASRVSGEIYICIGLVKGMVNYVQPVFNSKTVVILQQQVKGEKTK
jgi:hypothetical protein